jgi:hypothetical protein
MTDLGTNQLAAGRPPIDRAQRRFAIFGSCVSGDIFRLNRDLGQLVSYHARCSLLSLMSSPLEFGDDDLDWPSNFAKRTVKADFEKTFFDDLEASKCDTLIVDFVDERWDLLRIGDSIVTCSAFLMKMGIDRLTRRGFARVARSDARTQELWRDACTRFAATLRERLPDLQVVLHKVLGAYRCRDGEEFCELAPFADGVPLGVVNPMLEDCNACLGSHLESLVELDLPRTYAADKNHCWGISPFHFEERYYKDAANFLSSCAR